MLVNILFGGLLLSFVSVLWIASVGYFFLSTQLRHSEMRWLLCGPPLSYICFVSCALRFVCVRCVLPTVLSFCFCVFAVVLVSVFAFGCSM